MEYLMLVSLSLDSLLYFFAYYIFLTAVNFIAFVIDYGALLHLVSRCPLSALPQFMWSARMGYSAPFILGLTELTLVGYLTVYAVISTYAVTSTTIYAKLSFWRVYFWVFLFQRISRLAVLVRSPMLNLSWPAQDESRTTTAQSEQTRMGYLNSGSVRHRKLSLGLCLICFLAWFYLACVLRWTELAHHVLVAHSFLICLYTSHLVQWTTWLMTSHIWSDVIPDQMNQLSCTTFCLHLIPACLLPSFWSPNSGPARIQWVVELFLLLLVHLYDRYRYDDRWTEVRSQLHTTALPEKAEALFCALCLRRRHRPFVSFSGPDPPEPDVLPCQHAVHRACFRIWQAMAPECAQCKLVMTSSWITRMFSKASVNAARIETVMDEEDEVSSRSWSSDSLDRVSSVVSSASSEMSVYDDKDIDLQVYMDLNDVERGGVGSSSSSSTRTRPLWSRRPGLMDDSTSSDESIPARRFGLHVEGLVTGSDDSNMDVDAESDPTTSFWIPSG